MAGSEYRPAIRNLTRAMTASTSGSCQLRAHSGHRGFSRAAGQQNPCLMILDAPKRSLATSHSRPQPGGRGYISIFASGVFGDRDERPLFGDQVADAESSLGRKYLYCRQGSATRANHRQYVGSSGRFGHEDRNRFVAQYRAQCLVATYPRCAFAQVLERSYLAGEIDDSRLAA